MTIAAGYLCRLTPATGDGAESSQSNSSTGSRYVRIAAPGATVAVYVWDYAGGMQMMRYFWDAAKDMDPAARDDGRRAELREVLRVRLPTKADGTIRLTARAWAVQGIRP